MSVRLGVVMDPISAISFKKDSTMAMLWAAADRGWSLHYMEPRDLSLDQGQPLGRMAPLEVFRDPERWYRLGDAVRRPLTELDVILMRRDPPFNNEYIYNTYILEAAEREGTLIVNRCESLRDCNEKVFATLFPQCCPPVLVSGEREQLKAFHAEHRDVIFKPLDGMGGASIFHVRENDPNINVILETLTHFGQRTIMAQRYLPEIRDGDKRILMIEGEPIPYCLARLPSQGETRGNLAAGGQGRAQPLSERDRWIADQVGDYLTEVNVTSPTCIREIDAAYDTDIGGQLMDLIGQRLAERSPA